MARIEPGFLLRRGQNLADLIDKAAARLNLGLGSAATQGDDRYAHRGNNLSDLESAATARSSLGLGSAATANQGAGNGLDADTLDGLHAAAFVPTGRAITAGTGLTGGGDLSADRTLDLASAHQMTTGNVLTQTAGAATGAVGTYALARTNNDSTNAPGDTEAGSNLSYVAFDGDNFEGSGTLSGTWQAMGHTTTTAVATVWLRIA